MILVEILQYLVAAAGLVLYHLATSGFTVASISYLGFWAYPALFGLDFVSVVLVMLVLSAAGDGSRKPSAIRGKMSAFVSRRFGGDERRFSGAWWLRLRRRGAFLMILVAAVVVSVFTIPFLNKWLKIPDQRAYVYAFLAVLINTIIKVSFYLGALEAAVRIFWSVMDRFGYAPGCCRFF